MAGVRGVDVIAVDLPACGAADMSPTIDLSLPARAERLRALLDALGIDRVHLVGHDIGAGIARVFAVRYTGASSTSPS